MFTNQNNNIITSSAQIEIGTQFFNSTNNNVNKNCNHLPSCIVIGCKNGNGYSNSSVKYYQVPTINFNSNDNLSSIARQWYINTLREDLLDFVSNKNNSNVKTNDLSSLPTPHFVCIEHFDEESFMLTGNDNSHLLNDQQNMMILKEDAVPSLFEIEVFQKMIAHQEQIALNQQKQLIQLNHQQQQQQQHQHQQQHQQNYMSNHLMNGQQQQNMQNQQKPSFLQSIPVKRARMDPDTRAALIQRVPKAVKRTSLLSMAIQPTIPVKQNNMQPSTPPLPQPQQMKAAKAVKHTMPRFLLNNNQPAQFNNNLDANKNELNKIQPQQQQQQQQVKAQKAVKHTSANILLPPPIMQSTKRMNKAVKHTGGGSNAYYQSLNKTSAQQPHNLSTENKSQQSQPQPTINKVPMTTTYVYKRILQQPDIDLNLECEDEEIILVSAPSTPPTPPPPVKVPLDVIPIEVEPLQVVLESKKEELAVNKPNSPISAKNLNTVTKKLNLDETEPEIKKKEATDESVAKIALKKTTLKNLVNEVSKTDTKEIKRAINTTVVPETTTQTKQNKSINKQGSNLKEKCKKKADSSSESEVDSEMDEYDDYDDEDDDEEDEDEDEEEDDDDLNDDDYEEPSCKKQFRRSSLSITSKLNNNIVNYANVLGKFYARSHVTNSNNNSETESSSKRGKYSNKVPRDLIVGNYPAKCNVCNLILDNNIELTSHICSHLESGGSNNSSHGNGPNSDPNTYISPFDAVTTTCGVCDTTFQQPFDLIKHLDQKHMKQLNEFKCRICEKQHSKLSELIAHLNQTHVSQEMPYRCDACGFRTSFYADAIYHIKKEHKSTLRHFCPYCLKSLVLPYNEKQGYVQCNLFYSHLITHFNKHENEMLMPSKCKHCQKCILHVRYMKEHLCTDHTSNSLTNNNNTSNSSIKLRKTLTESNSTNNLKGNKPGTVSSKTKDIAPNEAILTTTLSNKKMDNSKKEKPKASNNKTNLSLTIAPATVSGTNKKNSSLSISNTPNNSLNLRKRRRSTLSERETNDSNSETTTSNSKQNIYEFVDDEINEKDEMKLLNEIIKIEPNNFNETSQNGGSKVRGRRASNSISKSTGTTAKQNVILNKTDENPNKRARLSFTRTEIELNVLAGPPYKRKQKALKQTTIKKLPGDLSFRTGRTPSFDESMKALIQSIPLMPPKPVGSPEIITTMLAGNIRFNHNKNKFKCVECGDTDLKTHFRNDYTCHQCRYNTNCSNSFEYHLHGHLVSKRVALWNKVLKTKTEEYKCPCGFFINSTVDNNYNANTGNKVAAHLLKCEYKFCQVNIEEEDKIVLKNENVTNKTDDTIENDKSMIENLMHINE